MKPREVCPRCREPLPGQPNTYDPCMCTAKEVRAFLATQTTTGAREKRSRMGRAIPPHAVVETPRAAPLERDVIAHDEAVTVRPRGRAPKAHRPRPIEETR